MADAATKIKIQEQKKKIRRKPFFFFLGAVELEIVILTRVKFINAGRTKGLSGGRIWLGKP